MSFEPLSDEELVAQTRAEHNSPRSDASINTLFERYHRQVSIWCLRLTGDRESAADLAQEVFLKAHKHLDSFRGTAKFSTWLYAIARNHCFNYLKFLSRRPVQVGDESLLEVSDESMENSLRKVEKEDSDQLVRELLSRVLDDTEKRVMVLHYCEEVPLGAITRLLELNNPSGAKAYIVNAKRKLKRAIERRRSLENRVL